MTSANNDKPSIFTRSPELAFLAYSVYCLLFALMLNSDESWQDGMLGAAVAYACAALHLALVRREGSDDA